MDLILQAGPVVKLVLLILVYFSVVSWAIIAFKMKMIYGAIKASERFQDFFWSKKRLDLVAQGLKPFEASPLSVLFREAYREMGGPTRSTETSPDEAPIDPDSRRGSVARALRRACTKETQRLEKFLTFLATTASAAPFIGLFGTVWGIMDAFIGIGKTGNASLAVVAPGISEALIATAIGLAAAIPAVIGYNFLLSKINGLVGEMDSFSQDLLNIVERMDRR